MIFCINLLKIIDFTIDKYIKCLHTLRKMSASTTIRIGSRVYLKIAIAGDPGCITSFDKRGRAIVDWYDLGISTRHYPDNLIVDEAFQVLQLDLFDIDPISA